LIRYFTLTSAEEGFLRKFLGQRNVLGASAQLCTLPWLGFVPDEVGAAPAAAVTRLADRLGIPAVELRGHGERAQTRTDHLWEIVRYSGWRLIGTPEWKEFDEFLFARAMEHDSPKLLFSLGCEYLLSERVVRPGVVHLLEPGSVDVAEGAAPVPGRVGAPVDPASIVPARTRTPLSDLADVAVGVGGGRARSSGVAVRPGIVGAGIGGTATGAVAVPPVVPTAVGIAGAYSGSPGWTSMATW
jgi:hypothetical protein